MHVDDIVSSNKRSRSMKAKDVMTSPVLSIDPDSSVLQAVQVMLQRHISGLPVLDREGRLVGMITEGDFLRRAETGTQRRRPRWLEYLVGPGWLADEYARSHGRKVHEVMTADPISVGEDATLEDVVRTHGKASRQARARGAGSRSRRHHQPGEPRTCARGYCPRDQTARSERSGHSGPHRGGARRPVLGPAGARQRHGARWRGGSVGDDHR